MFAPSSRLFVDAVMHYSSPNLPPRKHAQDQQESSTARPMRWSVERSDQTTPVGVNRNREISAPMRSNLFSFHCYSGC